MAGFQEKDKALFPVRNITSIIQLFKNQLESATEPDLALLSIIAGAVENSLTCRSSNAALQAYEPQSLPPLELHTVEALYSKFHIMMKTAVDSGKNTGNSKKFATRALVKKVSDVIWNSLTRSYYNDRAHLQVITNSLYKTII